ncbi:MAG: hypothetical protein HY926_08275 [Elusimicrobia bacterium]|nr:hypothetical protein [Elusimicrobiota bacterium]
MKNLWRPLALLALGLALAACTCRGKPQETRSMAPVPETLGEKRKPADFPAEKVEKPKDLEQGEGVPKEMQDAIEKGLEKAKKGKKTQ